MDLNQFMLVVGQNRPSASGTSPLTRHTTAAARRRRVWKMKNYGERDDASRNVFTSFPFLSPEVRDRFTSATLLNPSRVEFIAPSSPFHLLLSSEVKWRGGSVLKKQFRMVPSCSFLFRPRPFHLGFYLALEVSLPCQCILFSYF